MRTLPIQPPQSYSQQPIRILQGRTEARHVQVTFSYKRTCRLRTDLWQEGERGFLELKAKEADTDDDDACDDPEIFKLMIEYIYHFDYLRGIDLGPVENKKRAGTSILAEPSLGNEASSPPGLETWIIKHARVFAMAIKYRVDGLCDLAASKFKEAATVYWDTKNFSHVISIVYQSTNEEVTQLRDIVVDVLHDHTEVFRSDEVIESLVYSMTGLAHALLKRSRHAAEVARDTVKCTSDHVAPHGRIETGCKRCKALYPVCASCVYMGHFPRCSNFRCL
jgi:hypothetical protein